MTSSSGGLSTLAEGVEQLEQSGGYHHKINQFVEYMTMKWATLTEKKSKDDVKIPLNKQTW